ncbi:bifunctional [glutamine synthetase] adenylyltransferase/[glutamine synthetase]-adenylyl-L-tyrosine phosphorylase [Phreatobacter oligotrophus]|uniref:Bifunctional glutamine synthetase adenylyltransferase/adenylyl-removing enzyme n=1 Tax=Phreatobacter oligotrophus TaxID=1122261 RepID=A0A2T4ZFD0_9HYPH|nr:bifunctional [glutamine synthetase] adenylyltransferase/[glutamine synthetase]-adenylyl-L-tyrosine phosphorylase [Phreatobacter oligotrophus]PTM60634.1 glutamate-ammonia-ligase adenylyltransferase [Phreatobacter oligotrophus]
MTRVPRLRPDDSTPPGLAARLKAAPVLPKGESAAKRIAAFLDGVEDAAVREGLASLLKAPKVRALVAGILVHSPFLAGIATHHPAHLLALLAEDPDACFARLKAEAVAACRKARSDEGVGRALRRFRSEVALLVALADIGDVWPLETVTRALTETADLAVAEAVVHLMSDFAEAGTLAPPDLKRPEAASGYIVLAMGKHGAFELNYSSDIDLIVFFDPDKAPMAPGKDAQPAYVRLTQRLVKILQERTADGYVFRTDLRLRPDPGATAVAISVPAALHYYETIGQTWERSAFIKARPCAGDIAAGEAFLQEMQPFIWRKYLDYTAVADVHAMKRQIHAFRGHDAVAVEGHNIKLGRGGIREIEFFVQTQQLIAGGRNASLRVRDTITGLERLREAGWVAPETRLALEQAYRYLRRVEHRLQMVADEQTHSLPESTEGVTRIAQFLGYRDHAAFAEALTAELRPVEAAYAKLFETLPPLAEVKGTLDLASEPPKATTLASLKDLGFTDPPAAIATVLGWQNAKSGGLRAREARERVAELAPALIDALSRSGDADLGLRAFDRLLSRHSQPIELLAILRTHPGLLELISQILGSAPRLADLLGRRAHVLDALLEPAFFGELPSDAALAARLAATLGDAADAEDVLDRARIFGQEQLFLTSVRVLAGTVSAEAAGQAFARLAEQLIKALYDAVTGWIASAHGTVPGMRTAVVAMGKLGGREMTAGSDLDLILLYDHDPNETASDGPRPLSGSHYFSRLTQRLVSALSAPTSEGVLYDVDLRLRPSGRSGPVATHLAGFRAYQAKEAWTWEHMALTRARVIAASPGFEPEVTETIRKVLTAKRPAKATLADIVDMRRAIAEDKGEDDRWDLKYVRGGLIDIEFVAQALQLVHGARHPEILDPNTMRVLDRATAAGLVKPAEGDVLRNACRLYQRLTQILRLCLVEGFDKNKASPGLKRLLARAGELPDFATLDAHLAEVQKQVRKAFEAIVGEI